MSVGDKDKDKSSSIGVRSCTIHIRDKYRGKEGDWDNILNDSSMNSDSIFRSKEMKHQENQFSVPDGVTTSVVFVVENQELYVSKEVLALTSPVFRSMFESDFLEREASTIPLPGKKYSEMMEFLLCLYPNTQKDISEENVYSVFRIADEYQVDILRDRCVEFLRRRCSDPLTSLSDLVAMLRTAETFYLSEIYTCSLKQVTRAQPSELAALEEYRGVSEEAKDEITYQRSKALDHVKLSDDTVYEVLRDASEYNECELVRRCEDHLIDRCKKTEKPLIHGIVTMLCAADKHKLNRLREIAIELATKRKSHDLEASPIFKNIDPETRFRIIAKRMKNFETLFAKLVKLRNHCCRKHSDYNCKICFISATKDTYATIGMCF